MIVGGQLMLPGDNQTVRLVPGHLRVEGGVIAEVVEGELPKAELCDEGGPGCVVLPGLVDAHVHLPQFEVIGAHGLPLLEWLDRHVWPAESRWADTSYAADRTDRAITQLFRAGTTAIGAYATVHAEGTQAALQTAAQRGMRGVVGQVLMDRGAPEALCRPASRLLDESDRLLQDFSSGDIKAAVTPRFALSCSEALLSGAGALAEQHDAVVQTHLAETVAECEAVAALFDGKRYVQVYRDAGLVRQGAIFGHGIHLDDDDRRVLAEAGSVVAHCPTANAFLASGRMDRAAHQTAGLGVALGSDIGAGYERSMVRVAREMLLNAGALGHNISADQAWWHITAGNAAALRLEGAGKLAVGASAEVVVVRPGDAGQAESGASLCSALGLNEQGEVGVLAALMFGWDDRWVRRVLVRGEAVV